VTKLTSNGESTGCPYPFRQDEGIPGCRVVATAPSFVVQSFCENRRLYEELDLARE
jgi:hypothetical protein